MPEEPSNDVIYRPHLNFPFQTLKIKVFFWEFSDRFQGYSLMVFLC